MCIPLLKIENLGLKMLELCWSWSQEGHFIYSLSKSGKMIVCICNVQLTGITGDYIYVIKWFISLSYTLLTADYPPNSRRLYLCDKMYDLLAVNLWLFHHRHLGVSGRVGKALDSESDGQGFDCHCWLCVEASGNFSFHAASVSSAVVCTWRDENNRIMLIGLCWVAEMHWILPR